MFRHLLGGGDMMSFLISLLLTLPIVLLSLSLHETAHGYMAWRLGDPTAKSVGRLTLNPAKHLDPIGFTCMLLTGFGWATPVPVNSRYFKKPRRDIALVGAAGPISNLLLATVFLLLLRFLGFGHLATLSPKTEFQFNLIYFTLLFLYYGVYMNVTLAVFNLLPVPPLDGSRILYLLLPPKALLQGNAARARDRAGGVCPAASGTAFCTHRPFDHADHARSVCPGRYEGLFSLTPRIKESPYGKYDL